jgi:hypothetical protein
VADGQARVVRAHALGGGGCAWAGVGRGGSKRPRPPPSGQTPALLQRKEVFCTANFANDRASRSLHNTGDPGNGITARGHIPRTKALARHSGTVTAPRSTPRPAVARLRHDYRRLCTAPETAAAKTEGCPSSKDLRQRAV